jgi:restriction system protein
MSIPDFQTIMLPLLERAADGQTHHMRDVTRELAGHFYLTEDEREQMLPSGQQTVFDNRVGWAKTHLKMAGLLDNTRRGYISLTDRGRQVLAERPERIDLRFLTRFPGFTEFRQKTRTTEEVEEGNTEAAKDAKTPEEQLEASYLALRQALADDLLERVKSCTPAFFERLVVQLLVAMGYGGSLADAGQAVGRTGDGGIDGIIKEDRLGLDTICVQAKRWENTVGRPVVQGFAGSMEGVRARKGVLITTSDFSRDAEEYVARIERKIVLIDGATLAQLLIDHGIGVSTARSYDVKRIDSDYFTEEDV